MQHCSAVVRGNGGGQHGQNPVYLWLLREESSNLFWETTWLWPAAKKHYEDLEFGLGWTNEFVSVAHVQYVCLPTGIGRKQRMFVLLVCSRHTSGCMAGGALFGWGERWWWNGPCLVAFDMSCHALLGDPGSERPENWGSWVSFPFCDAFRQSCMVRIRWYQ